MSRLNFTTLFLVMVLVVPSSIALHAQNAPAAPVPVQILNAKKVFISNNNFDYLQKNFYSGGPQRTYDEFYNDIKTETQYQIVSSPADADLVLEISFDNSKFYFQLRVLDPKTQTLLWKFAASVSSNGTKSTRDKHFSAAIETLVADLKSLSNQPSSTAK